MSSKYDTPDNTNPDHQGKTFIYDVTSRNITDLLHAYQQSSADMRRLFELKAQTVSSADLALRRLEAMGGSLSLDEFEALLIYLDNVGLLRRKFRRWLFEVRDICRACWESLYDKGWDILPYLQASQFVGST
ncbi:MAG: hypothetical protein Q9208_004599 [Pyrenodesmia sp. 3 TL-2023]